MSETNLLRKSIINSANINTVGNIFMSISLGSVSVAILYVAAIIIGSFNKYNSLIAATNNHCENTKNTGLIAHIRDIISSPSITANIIIIACLFNVGVSLFELFTNGDEIIKHLSQTAMWTFMTIGGFSLSQLDKTNFSAITEQTKEVVSTIKSAFRSAMANPVVFYCTANVVIVPYLLMIQETTYGQILTGIAGIVFLTGTVLTIRNTVYATKGKIEVDQINDGMVNYFSATGLIISSGLCVIVGQYFIAAAFTMFAMGAITALRETLSALEVKA